MTLKSPLPSSSTTLQSNVIGPRPIHKLLWCLSFKSLIWFVFFRFNFSLFCLQWTKCHHVLHWFQQMRMAPMAVISSRMRWRIKIIITTTIWRQQQQQVAVAAVLQQMPQSRTQNRDVGREHVVSALNHLSRMISIRRASNVSNGYARTVPAIVNWRRMRMR